MEQQHWRKLDGTRIRGSIEREILTTLALEKAAGYELRVCIGTDSQVKSRQTDFATVIVFVRKGRGAFMYIRDFSTAQKMSLKQRMLLEVQHSVEVAYALADLFTAQGVEMEVHADINTDPAEGSHVALKDAMGYITGMGFLFRAKPNAFASSACANKMVQ